MSARDVAFWLLAIASVITAVTVIRHPNPVRAALFLVLNFVCLAGLYLNLEAPMLAALQVLVYAGAIMVLFLFVIQLLNLGGEQSLRDPLGGQTPFALILGAILFGGLAAALVSAGTVAASFGGRNRAPAVAGQQQIRDIGTSLMTDYVYPFELTSILLLVGIIGAVLLARRESRREEEANERQ
jgi:NADH-quinone oxidoreductase subunit J